MDSKIPIENIYYLLCYAWNRLEETGVVEVEATTAECLPDLFARILITGTSHLFRRGLARGYILQTDEIPGIRGKILLTETLKRCAHVRSKAVCAFDEMNHDLLHNRVLKSTLRTLAETEDLDKRLRNELIHLYRKFHGVELIELTPESFRHARIHRNNRSYDFLLNVCELVFDSLLPTEDSGSRKFRDFSRDKRAMAGLFEEFVRNFYRSEQGDFTVSREQISWKGRGLDAVSTAHLPRMETDISLKSRTSSRKIIIDTKFYEDALTSKKLSEESKSARSGHLYQLLAYLKNLEDEGENKACEGMLLYPANGDEVKLEYELLGHPIRISTVNLNQKWIDIKNDLLNLLSCR